MGARKVANWLRFNVFGREYRGIQAFLDRKMLIIPQLQLRDLSNAHGFGDFTGNPGLKPKRCLESRKILFPLWYQFGICRIGSLCCFHVFWGRTVTFHRG